MDKAIQEKYFWNNYLALLSENGVKPALLTRYVSHCKNFIRENGKIRLKQHTVESVSAYLNKLINSPEKQAWQNKQAIDALQYLFKCIRATLHREIDWDYWKSSCKDLAPDHDSNYRTNHPLVNTERVVSSTRNNVDEHAVKQCRRACCFQ